MTENALGELEHSVDSYERYLTEWGTPAGQFEKFGEFIPFTTPDGFENPVFVPRVVKEKELFKPLIRDAELLRIKAADGKPERLQLKLSGDNLLYPAIKECQFNLGFPFAKDETKYQVRFWR